jgi:2-keto-4-pentenoate hydratase/2-oxohepta-3-ene-1,7-dioic acid hydratase in catechol pathway
VRIIRFIDRYGDERLGTDLVEGTAEVLDGRLFGELSRSGRRIGVSKLLAPISPPNIFGIGLNYAEHVRQLGAGMPDRPVVFMKPTTAIANPGEPILLPDCCVNGPEVDYECELAVVIGRATRNVAEGEALSYVFGYSAANDITARHWAKSTSRTRGKSFDRFCPLGPALVTADEIPDPQCLALTTTLNGLVVQKGSTADMIFSVAELVSFLSQDTTLLPGTLILTGTPPGSGITRNPPSYLRAGDRVCVEVEMVGCLSNDVDLSDHARFAAA